MLPQELGLSMEQTAVAVGRSVGATCTMRTRFMAVREGRSQAPRSKRDLRIEQRLGATMVLSSVYRMLARHGWRKLAPDTQHPKGDAQVREDWGKNSPARWSKSRPVLSAKRP